jgi:peptidylprolyl isomerase
MHVFPRAAVLAFAAALTASLPTAVSAQVGTTVTTPSGMKMTDTVVGTGATPRRGQTCVMHYTGWLYQNGAKGQKFDSSLDRGRPFEFPIGMQRVIPGWDEGVATMKVGGKRTLIIPPPRGRRCHPAKCDADLRSRTARREGLDEYEFRFAPPLSQSPLIPPKAGIQGRELGQTTGDERNQGRFKLRSSRSGNATIRAAASPDSPCCVSAGGSRSRDRRSARSRSASRARPGR